MLSSTAICFILAGLSNAALWNHTKTEGKAVWNFQWNFGGNGAQPPPEIQPPALPACSTEQGCVQGANCMALVGQPAMGCLPAFSSPCYMTAPDPTTCSVDPATPMCQCLMAPSCAVVSGCLMPANCMPGPCNYWAEPGQFCFSTQPQPPTNCINDPNLCNGVPCQNCMCE